MIVSQISSLAQSKEHAALEKHPMAPSKLEHPSYLLSKG
jgi:hypothetical protein